MNAGVAFGQHHLGSDCLYFFKTAARHGYGIFGVSPPDATTGTTAECIGMMALHFHKIRCDFSDNLPRLFVDAAVSPQVAGIVIGDPFVGLNTKVGIFQKLADVKNLYPLFL